MAAKSCCEICGKPFPEPVVGSVLGLFVHEGKMGKRCFKCKRLVCSSCRVHPKKLESWQLRRLGLTQTDKGPFICTGCTPRDYGGNGD